MPLVIQSEVLWGWEARCALSMLVEGDSPASTREALSLKLPSQADKLRDLFAVPEAVYVSVQASVDVSDPALRFLFTKLDGFEKAPVDALLGHSLPSLRGELDRPALLSAHPDAFRETLSLLYDFDEHSDPLPPAEDMRALFRWLHERGATEAVQSALLRVHTQTESLLNALWPSLQAATRAVKECADGFEREIAHLTSLSEEEMFASLRCLGLTMNPSDNYLVFPTVMWPNRMDLTKDDNSPAYVLRVGARLLELTPLIEGARKDVLSLQAVLHTITDKTKLDILVRLADRPWYGAELAEALGLSGATVSHHMGQLLGHSLLTVENAGNRLYYYRNSTRIKEVLEDLRRLLKL